MNCRQSANPYNEYSGKETKHDERFSEIGARLDLADRSGLRGICFDPAAFDLNEVNGRLSQIQI